MNVIIPIETKVRELDGVIWLSLHLVDRGHTVYFGKTPSIYESVNLFEGNVIFTQGASKFMDRYYKCGINTVYLDQEGGIFRTDERYRDRIDDDGIGKQDIHFTWGDKQESIAKEAGHENVIPSGDPRFDLLTDPLDEIYDEGSRELIERFGDYVLINTNFANGNHLSKSNVDLDVDIELAKQTDNRDTWERYLTSEYIQMAREIVSRTNVESVIIRAHPSENHATYASTFKNHDDVHVIHEGSVRPWIAGSRAVIHTGCTTGVESIMMDTPTYAYTPDRGQSTQPYLPNAVSKEVVGLDTLIELVETARDSPLYLQTNEEQYNLLRSHFSNIDEMAAPIIADAITELSPANTSRFSPSLREGVKRAFVWSTNDRFITWLRKTELKKTWKTSNQKFSYVTDTEVQEFVDRLCEYAPVNDVKLRRIKRLENTFELSC